MAAPAEEVPRKTDEPPRDLEPLLADPAAARAVAKGEDKRRSGSACLAAGGNRWIEALCSSWGPGLLVCLADTDAGCLMVAAESGAAWSYSLLWLQVILIPPLFLVQELTIRLGAYAKMGHTACIRERFGPFWAWFTVTLLFISCTGAIVSEMSGIAGVAKLWGMTTGVSIALAAVLLVSLVFFGSYRVVEIISIALGLCELSFVLTMFLLRPSPKEVFEGSVSFPADPEGHRGFMWLVAANIGAVIMPWMIYFQQSAVVARRIQSRAQVDTERCHTMFGSCLTQLIMIGTLVSIAAVKTPRSLKEVTDIAIALQPALGPFWSKLMVSFAMLGGALCASFVVSLTAAWAVCEAGQWDDPFAIDRSPMDAPAFYGSFLAVVGIGAGVLCMGFDTINLNVYIETMDAILMPVVVLFLFILVTDPTIPDGVRVQGFHKASIAIMFTVCSVVALVCCGFKLVGS